MRNGFYSSLITLVATAGVALGDEPRGPGPGPAPGPIVSFQPTPFAENCAPACVPQESCCSGGRFWGSAEFLLWRVKDGHVPPLGTAGPADSTGVLGSPGVVSLFGSSVNDDTRTGGRFTIGAWLNCDCTKGIEASYFFLNRDSTDLGAGSPGTEGSTVIGRPFFNVITGLPDVQIVALPGVVAGTLLVSSTSELRGGEVNLLCGRCCHQDCCCNSGYRLNFLVGFRVLELNEDLTIREDLTFLDTAPEPFVPGSTITVIDRFETRNRFYGGQIGARAEWWRGRCFANLTGKVALGVTHQEVRVSGATVFTDPDGVAVVQPGGLLALPTNIGRRSRDRFTVVPEIGFNVGYQVTDHVRAFVGYNFLYWSSVVRPGDQIDLGINPTQLPSAEGPGTLEGPARPAPLFRDTTFWAHGINVGLELRW